MLECARTKNIGFKKEFMAVLISTGLVSIIKEKNYTILIGCHVIL